jgi:hypothetical protein
MESQTTTLVSPPSRLSRVVGGLLLAALSLLTFSVWWQARVISQQRELIRQMYQDTVPKASNGRV